MPDLGLDSVSGRKTAVAIKDHQQNLNMDSELDKSFMLLVVTTVL